NCFFGLEEVFFTDSLADAEPVFPGDFFSLSGFVAIVLKDCKCKISAKFLILQIFKTFFLIK
ncbi:MAG TPA: hypothetical protein VIV35_10405, partial [Chitinophagaceae bacterium]